MRTSGSGILCLFQTRLLFQWISDGLPSFFCDLLLNFHADVGVDVDVADRLVI